MVAAISSDTKRPPLLPDRENGRRPRAREVPSRYMSMSISPATSSSNTTNSSNTSISSASSSSVSRRFPSPLISTTTPKRSQSVDRRRGSPKTVEIPVSSAAAKLLVTSTRSLSVSFQGEAFSLPVSKAKAKTKTVNQVVVVGRKATPERRGTGRGCGGVEYSKPIDQHRWPARTRQFSISISTSTSNVDDVGDNKFVRSSEVGEGRVLRGSLGDESTRVSFDGLLSLESAHGGDVLCGIRGDESSDVTASDTESVSSGSTSGAQEMNGGRGVAVSARFWQETNMRLRRLQDPGLGLSSTPSSKFVTPPKLSQSRKFSDGPVMTSPRTMSSPIRGAIRAASPSKIMSSVASPLRGLSPSRVRSSIGGMLGCSPWDTPSVLSFAVDVRRGKVGENRIVDAHQLRLLYNRHLQWRFVNARADAALSMQRQLAEKNMWNAWITITALRDSVKHKRAQVQLLRQKLKLSSILKGQMTYLEEWSHLDKDHCSSLQGAIEALKASTLRLPVVGGVTADIHSVKEAICSAVDVMQSMAASSSSLLTKLEEVNSLMAELSKVAAKERIMLERCKEVLSVLLSMQVRDCSMRTHILQINRSP